MDMDYDIMYTPNSKQMEFYSPGDGKGTQSFTGLQTLGLEIHGIWNSDPGFVNASGGDFSLISGSPAVDKGIVLVQFNDANSPWPYQGLAPDIGAYEYASGPDTTPPTRSSGSPSGTLSAGTTQTTMSLTTNENATCKYGTVSASYASLPNTFTTTGVTSHSQLITGLTNGSTYTYYIRCQDTAGNANTDDYPISFSVASAGDTTPPTISSVASSNITSNSAIITWTTNETSDSQVEYGVSASYGNSTTLNTSLVTSHSVSLSGLSASTLYHYRVKSRDAAANSAVSSDYNFTTSAAGGGTPGTINLQVSASSDDADQFSSTVNLSGTSISAGRWAGGDMAIGIRFTGLGIPTGATINTAYIQLREDSSITDWDAISAKIYADDQQSPPTFSSGSGPLARTLTTAQIPWSLDRTDPGVWYGNTVEIKSVIQELVNSYGAINSVAIIVNSNGMTDWGKVKSFYSWDYSDHSSAPKLHIEYTSAATFILGDFNHDGKVNILDVSILLSKWGSTNATDLQLCDINVGPSNTSQNKIDIYDANLMMKNWLP